MSQSGEMEVQKRGKKFFSYKATKIPAITKLGVSAQRDGIRFVTLARLVEHWNARNVFTPYDRSMCTQCDWSI